MVCLETAEFGSNVYCINKQREMLKGVSCLGFEKQHLPYFACFYFFNVSMTNPEGLSGKRNGITPWVSPFKAPLK